MTEQEIDHTCAKLMALLYIYGGEEFVVQCPLQALCMGCAELFDLKGGESPAIHKVEMVNSYLKDLAKDNSKSLTFSNCLSVEDALKISWVKEISERFNVFSWTKPKSKNRRKSESVPEVRQTEEKEM